MYYTLLLRDVIEILFYSCIIYTFCVWLKTDKTKNILAYFIAYCMLIVIAWSCEMPTVTPFLCTYAPIAIMLFIVLHQKTLQRNLVALRTITTKPAHQEDWLDTLLSSSLAIINNNKSITIIIENKDSLDYFLTTPFFINADISKNIVTILLSSSSYEEHNMIWVTKDGKIKGINATWQETPQQPIISTSFNKKDALFYTLQTDAVILHINPHTRNFTLITQGKETTNIPTHTIKHMIEKQLKPHSSLNSKRSTHEGTTTEKPLS